MTTGTATARPAAVEPANLGAAEGGAESCLPSPAHPQPVVLVHGTFGDSVFNWPYLRPALERAGYCVFALDYGNRGTGPIEDSAHQLGEFVDRVLEATGAEKVDLLGHSQGGMMPRYYIKFLGGRSAVDDLVGLAPSHHGTGAPLAPPAGPPHAPGPCTACEQQTAGSDFLRNLNAGDESPGEVSYTSIATRYDGVVVPHTSSFLEPDSQVANVLLQDACPAHYSNHVTIAFSDPVALDWILNALENPGPADPAFRPSCSPARPGERFRPR